MTIICTTEALRTDGADPCPSFGVYHTSIPVRSLGRFTVRVDRKGGPVAYGFAIGAAYSLHDRSASMATLEKWAEPDVLCWAKRDPNHGAEARAEISRLQAELDAAYDRWSLLSDAWNEAGCPPEQCPVYPQNPEARARIRELRRPVPGPVHRTVADALAQRGLPPLTEGEANQIKVLE